MYSVYFSKETAVNWLSDLQSWHDSSGHLQHSLNIIIAVKHGLLILLKGEHGDKESWILGEIWLPSKWNHVKTDFHTCRSLLYVLGRLFSVIMKPAHWNTKITGSFVRKLQRVKNESSKDYESTARLNAHERWYCCSCEADNYNKTIITLHTEEPLPPVPRFHHTELCWWWIMKDLLYHYNKILNY